LFPAGFRSRSGAAFSGQKAKRDVYPGGPSGLSLLSLSFYLQFKITSMAKKTGMSDSSLWIFAIVLLAVAAWMYFR